MNLGAEEDDNDDVEDRSHVTLSDEEDLLESVEVEASPPRIRNGG